MTESELQIRLSKYLDRFFQVENEVWSMDYKRRIDIVLVHKSDTAREYPIGIEIKTFDKKTGSDAGKWLHQAQEYSKISFCNYGKLMIIIAPQFSENVFCEGLLMHKHLLNGSATHDHNVATFLGQFGIGEFQSYNYEDRINKNMIKKYRIVYNGKKIWDMSDNVLRINNYIALCKR